MKKLISTKIHKLNFSALPKLTLCFIQSFLYSDKRSDNTIQTQKQRKQERHLEFKDLMMYGMFLMQSSWTCEVGWMVCIIVRCTVMSVTSCFCITYVCFSMDNQSLAGPTEHTIIFLSPESVGPIIC